VVGQYGRGPCRRKVTCSLSCALLQYLERCCWARIALIVTHRSRRSVPKCIVLHGMLWCMRFVFLYCFRVHPPFTICYRLCVCWWCDDVQVCVARSFNIYIHWYW
jgi:hypothetical protein